MPKQENQILPFNQTRINTQNIKKQVVNNNYQPPPKPEVEQSKDEIWRFRVEPQVATRLDSMIRAKGTDRSKFTRDCIELGESFHDYKDVLLKNADLIIEVCRRISKNL